ncbi:MAG: alpha/beta hydrolase [Gammaproteobacteria bacterium]
MLLDRPAIPGREHPPVRKADDLHAARTPGKGRAFVTVGWVIGAGAGLYALACAFLYFAQDRLIYFPSKSMSATPSDVGLVYEDVRLQTSDGVRIHAWFVPAGDDSQPVAGPKAVLFFHGNAGNISDRPQTLLVFAELGLSTLMVDYRGYGLSEGSPDEAGTYRDAEAAWHYLVDTRGFEPKEILVFGRSLGGGIASWFATRSQPDGSPSRALTPAGLVLESTFTSIPDVAAPHYPLFPVRWLARVHYPSLERVSRSHLPLLVVHGRDDRTIPFTHGERIFRAAPGPKQFLELSGSHNGGFLLERHRYVQGLSQFIATLSAPESSQR